MKKLSSILILTLAAAVISCNNREKDSKEDTQASDSLAAIHQLNSYADSLKSIVGTTDSLLSRVYNAAVLSKNTDSIESIYQPLIRDLDQQMLELTTHMEKMLHNRQVDQERYEETILDIDMTRMSEERATIKMLGIDL